MQAAEARQRLTGQGLPTSSGGSLGPTGRKQSELCLHKWLHRKYYPFHHHQPRGLEDPVSCSKWDASGVTGLPWWLSGKESTCQCRRPRFDPGVRKIPWRRDWLPTPTFLPEENHRQRIYLVRPDDCRILENSLLIMSFDTASYQSSLLIRQLESQGSGHNSLASSQVAWMTFLLLSVGGTHSQQVIFPGFWSGY